MAPCEKRRIVVRGQGGAERVYILPVQALRFVQSITPLLLECDGQNHRDTSSSDGLCIKCSQPIPFDVDDVAEEASFEDIVIWLHRNIDILSLVKDIHHFRAIARLADKYHIPLLTKDLEVLRLHHLHRLRFAKTDGICKAVVLRRHAVARQNLSSHWREILFGCHGDASIDRTYACASWRHGKW